MVGPERQTDGRVEFGVDQLLDDVAAPRGVTVELGDRPLAEPLVGLRERVGDPDRERGQRVEVEVVQVVVVDDDRVVGSERGNRLARLLDPVEPRLPRNVGGLPAVVHLVVLDPHRRRM